ncbi:MAG TPA: methyltransferase domain-containing protein [Blastocatellia bacterium]|nr:methyltransferase domain-containing protein [Blastocatellia bacterium]
MTPVPHDDRLNDWFTPANVARYYQETHWHYRRLWHGKRSLALHYGYWDQHVNNHTTALHRLNEELARRAQIATGEMILDAGCGWGGSSIWLAHNYDVRTLGLSIEPKQVQQAQATARRLRLADKASFAVGDYHQMDVPDNAFDVVWAIESVCHSTNKGAFIREAWRVLKPGGRLVISDFFRTSRQLPDADEQVLQQWLWQWVIRDLATFQEFQTEMEMAGFVGVKGEDITQYIRPSARRLWLTGMGTAPCALVLRALGVHTDLLHGNWKSSLLQYQALLRQTWRYGIFSAQKK